MSQINNVIKLKGSGIIRISPEKYVVDRENSVILIQGAKLRFSYQVPVEARELLSSFTPTGEKNIYRLSTSPMTMVNWVSNIVASFANKFSKDNFDFKVIIEVSDIRESGILGELAAAKLTHEQVATVLLNIVKKYNPSYVQYQFTEVDISKVKYKGGSICVEEDKSKITCAIIHRMEYRDVETNGVKVKLVKPLYLIKFADALTEAEANSYRDKLDLSSLGHIATVRKTEHKNCYRIWINGEGKIIPLEDFKKLDDIVAKAFGYIPIIKSEGVGATNKGLVDALRALQRDGDSSSLVALGYKYTPEGYIQKNTTNGAVRIRIDTLGLASGLFNIGDSRISASAEVLHAVYEALDGDSGYYDIEYDEGDTTIYMTENTLYGQYDIAKTLIDAGFAVDICLIPDSDNVAGRFITINYTEYELLQEDVDACIKVCSMTKDRDTCAAILGGSYEGIQIMSDQAVFKIPGFVGINSDGMLEEYSNSANASYIAAEYSSEYADPDTIMANLEAWQVKDLVGEFRRFVAKPNRILAHQTEVEVSMDPGWGIQIAKPGDFIVDNNGNPYPIDLEAFKKTYRPVEGNIYEKAPVEVLAAPVLSLDLRVKTIDTAGRDDVFETPKAVGNILIRGALGEFYMTTREKFDSLYAQL